jgi:hypothetical protein
MQANKLQSSSEKIREKSLKYALDYRVKKYNQIFKIKLIKN